MICRRKCSLGPRDTIEKGGIVDAFIFKETIPSSTGWENKTPSISDPWWHRVNLDAKHRRFGFLIVAKDRSEEITQRVLLSGSGEKVKVDVL